MIVLETERLLFRDYGPGDLEPFCSLEADPSVRRYVGGKPRTHESARRKFRQSFLTPRESRLRLRATIFKEDGRYIGYCGIYPHFRSGKLPIRGEGALGFTLAPAYWGRGLATEAARAFVAFGLDELRLRRIVARVEVGNAASVHILETLGFKLWRLERINRRSFYHLELWNPSCSERVAQPNPRLQRARVARSPLSRQPYGAREHP